MFTGGNSYRLHEIMVYNRFHVNPPDRYWYQALLSFVRFQQLCGHQTYKTQSNVEDDKASEIEPRNALLKRLGRLLSNPRQYSNSYFSNHWENFRAAFSVSYYWVFAVLGASFTRISGKLLGGY